MNVAIIIPVVQAKLATDLLNQIKSGRYIPDQVITIDNTSSGFVCPIHASQQIRPKNAPLPVNPSWNLGLSHLRSDIDVVGILNDDIVITEWFISKAMEVFDTTLNCGIAVPREATEDEVRNYHTTPNRVRAHKTKKRSGWAFFVRRSALESIPPIPNDLSMFFGDAWIFQLLHIKGWYRYHMVDNPVFHYGGVTFKQGLVSRSRSLRARERHIYRKAIEEIKSCPTQART